MQARHTVEKRESPETGITTGALYYFLKNKESMFDVLI